MAASALSQIPVWEERLGPERKFLAGSGRRCRLPPFKGWCSSDAEVGAAATIDPQAAAVDTPGVIPNAGRTADLPDETNVAGSAHVAPVSAPIVGGAINHPVRRGRWAVSRDHEISAATTVDPEAPPVNTPGVIADARGAADLPDKTHIACRADVAPVSASVVGGAGDALRRRRTVPGLWRGRSGLSERGGDDGCDEQDKLRGDGHLASF